MPQGEFKGSHGEVKWFDNDRGVPLTDSAILNEIRLSIAEIERLAQQRHTMPRDIYERLVIRQYRDIMDFASKISTIKAASAVDAGVLSQRAAADLLSVHPHTLRRWMDTNPTLVQNATHTIGNEPPPNSIDQRT